MRNRLASVGVCVLALASLVSAIALQTHNQAAAQVPAAPPDTAALRAQYEKWRTELKTWGRWAPVGQESRGTTSLITPEKVASALRLARDGIVVSLAHPEPQMPAADVDPPGVFHRVINNITDTGTTDNYQVSYHGLTVAHIDTWCHFFDNGQMYNGVPVKDNVTNDNGCIKGNVMNWRGGVTTRAVLYDIAQLKGVDWADPNVPVTRADLEAWEKKSGVKIGPGDIPLLYTGRWKRRAAVGPWAGQVAGYYPDTRGCMSGCRPSSATTSTSTGIRGPAGKECAIRSTWRC
jgi:kynurenine formamidase